jgi:hypothetical protein
MDTTLAVDTTLDTKLAENGVVIEVLTDVNCP